MSVIGLKSFNRSITYITFIPNKFVHQMKLMLILALAGMLMLSVSFNQNVSADKVKCGDLERDMKWKDDGHGDNKASEKRFKKLAENPNTSLCELAKAIDFEKVEYKMSEKKFKSWFMDLPLWDTAYKEQKECIKDRADLGSKLKDYEIQNCATGEYD